MGKEVDPNLLCLNGNDIGKFKGAIMFLVWGKSALASKIGRQIIPTLFISKNLTFSIIN